eukprot:4598642-Pyramimonas_sp.AAC.1
MRKEEKEEGEEEEEEEEWGRLARHDATRLAACEVVQAPRQCARARSKLWRQFARASNRYVY